MSQINVNNIRAKDGVGPVGFPGGINATGVVTATTFSGNLTGAVTGNVTGNCSGTAGGLTGTPNITVGTVGCGNVTSSGNISATDATFSGNLTVNGTTTTIDTAVTAVDSLAVDGNVDVGAGISAYGYKVEEGLSEDSTGLNGLFNYDLDSGHYQKYSTATAGNYEPNFRVSGSKTLNSIMGVGDVVSAVLVVASSSHYLDSPNIQIDGSTSNITTHHIGGAAPSAANGSGYDIYSFTIQKTAATPAYYVIVNATSAA